MEEDRNNEEQVEERKEVSMEKRTRTMEVRAAGSMVLEGYAALFDEETDLGAFREVIARGAFDDVLEDDVRLLIDHEPPPLARTKNGTLQLSVDDKGLKYRAELVDTRKLVRQDDDVRLRDVPRLEIHVAYAAHSSLPMRASIWALATR